MGRFLFILVIFSIILSIKLGLTNGVDMIKTIKFTDIFMAGCQELLPIQMSVNIATFQYIVAGIKPFV